MWAIGVYCDIVQVTCSGLLDVVEAVLTDAEPASRQRSASSAQQASCARRFGSPSEPISERATPWEQRAPTDKNGPLPGRQCSTRNAPRPHLTWDGTRGVCPALVTSGAESPLNLPLDGAYILSLPSGDRSPDTKREERSACRHPRSGLRRVGDDPHRLDRRAPRTAHRSEVQATRNHHELS